TENPKYVGQTICVSLALARLGVVPGMIGGLIADAEEGLLEEHVENRQSEVESPKIESKSSSSPSTCDIQPSPPAEDCSPALAKPCGSQAHSVAGAAAKS